MSSAVVFPVHDPDGLLLPHLEAITPILKSHFDRAYVSVSGSTRDRHPERVSALQVDRFYSIFLHEGDGPVGDRFASLYRHAARSSPPTQVLHLVSLDRLAFALQTGYRSRFLADVHAVRGKELPLLFQRSAIAWRTHPRNYYEIERFVTTLGRVLFGKTLDYAWCHLVLGASTLAEILPRVLNHDLSMVAEMVLQLQATIRTREVDWLAWEDPFILGRRPRELKREREASPSEVDKRLAYVLPMVAALQRYAQGQSDR
jgi:hypothetical protein